MKGKNSPKPLKFALFVNTGASLRQNPFRKGRILFIDAFSGNDYNESYICQ